MGAPEGNTIRPSRPPFGAYSKRADRRRHHGGLRHGVRRLCALRIPAARGCFLLLGMVALLTLAAALLHGPALAGLGVVGAFVTPMLIASTKPDYWSLYIYIAVVTAAAFALARARLWQLLAVTAIAFSAAWTLPGMEYSSVAALGAHV